MSAGHSETIAGGVRAGSRHVVAALRAPAKGRAAVAFGLRQA